MEGLDFNFGISKHLTAPLYESHILSSLVFTDFIVLIRTLVFIHWYRMDIGSEWTLVFIHWYPLDTRKIKNFQFRFLDDSHLLWKSILLSEAPLLFVLFSDNRIFVSTLFIYSFRKTLVHTLQITDLV